MCILVAQLLSRSNASYCVAGNNIIKHCWINFVIASLTLYKMFPNYLQDTLVHLYMLLANQNTAIAVDYEPVVHGWNRGVNRVVV